MKGFPEGHRAFYVVPRTEAEGSLREKEWLTDPRWRRSR